MDADETHEDFREPTAVEEALAERREQEMLRELMGSWNGGAGEAEELRRTARAAVEDWLEAR